MSSLQSFWLFLFVASDDSSHPVHFFHRSHNSSASGNKLRYWFHPGHNPLQCINHEKNFRKLHRFTPMAIWPTKTNLVGVEIWHFIYIRIIRKPFVLPDSGKGCVTQQQYNPIKNKNPLYMIMRCVIPDFFSIFSSIHTCLVLGNSFSCISTHEGISYPKIFSLIPY